MPSEVVLNLGASTEITFVLSRFYTSRRPIRRCRDAGMSLGSEMRVQVTTAGGRTASTSTGKRSCIF